MNYIAIDVSKKKLIVFDGKKMRKFPNDRVLSEFRSYLEKNYRLNEIVLTFEPTGPYSLSLLDLAAKLSILVYVVNPAQAHWFSKALGNRSKTDPVDARSLYNFTLLLIKRGIAPIKVSSSLRRISHILSSYRHLQKQVQAMKNHIEALEFSNHSNAGFIEKLREEVVRLERLKQEAVELARAEILKDEQMRNDYERIISIRGIGEKSALWFVWFFNRYRGASRKQIIALCGLDVVEKQSGTSVKGRAHISKQGVSTIRAVLYFPTFTAIKYNPAIAAFYQRLLKKGKKKKLAAVACMRKLVLIAHAVWKSGKTWNEQKAIRYAQNLSLDFQDSI